MGEAPRDMGEAELGPTFVAGGPFSVELFCERKKVRDDGPAFDNLLISTMSADKDRPRKK
jgi:hypothetical protein